jgi:predicted metal-dependent hydrolase
MVPYLGEPLELGVSVVPGGRSQVRRQGGRLDARVGRAGDDALRGALERWFRAEARREVTHRLDAVCARVGRDYGRLSIRAQRTRWASCSASGDMSFNWRLLLAPEPILDYVVEHEVAHLDVPDHSTGFWALLAARCPDHREHERWLRRHGPALRL